MTHFPLLYSCRFRFSVRSLPTFATHGRSVFVEEHSFSTLFGCLSVKIKSVPHQLVMSDHFMSCDVMSCRTSRSIVVRLFMPCHVMQYHVLPCLVVPFCTLLCNCVTCRFMSRTIRCLVMPGHVRSCHGMSNHRSHVRRMTFRTFRQVQFLSVVLVRDVVVTASANFARNRVRSCTGCECVVEFAGEER